MNVPTEVPTTKEEEFRWMTEHQRQKVTEATVDPAKPHAKTFKEVWHDYMDKPTKTQQAFAWAMIVLVLVESAFLFLQAGKCFSTQSAKDIDLTAFIILLVANVLWTLYGIFVLHDFPLTLSGVMYCIGAVLVIIAYSMYNNPTPDPTPA